MSLNRSSKKIKVTSPVQRTPQPPKTYLGSHKIAASLIRKIDGYLDYKDTVSLARSGFHLHSALNPDKPALQQLLQSMIDHEMQTVTKILRHKPHLLLIQPATFGIYEIESKKTWQRFRTEKVFVMAQKLAKKLQRPATMTRALLPHFDNIKIAKDAKSNEKKEVTHEVVKQWILPVVPEDKEEQKQWAEQQKLFDQTLQRKYIDDHFKKLIKTLASDDSIEVKWEMNNESKFYEARVLNPSEDTEKALNAFRKMLLPDEAVAIDDYFDIAQLLIAAYNAYDGHFSDQYNSEIYFRNLHQRAAYAVCVIGFIIPLLGGPEVGKKWCRGFYYDVNNIPPPDVNLGAEALQLKDGRSFYRASRLSLVGPGFTFLCDMLCRARWGGDGVDRGPALLENYVKQMRQSLANLRGECIAEKSKLPQLGNRGA